MDNRDYDDGNMGSGTFAGTGGGSLRQETG